MVNGELDGTAAGGGNSHHLEAVWEGVPLPLAPPPVGR